MVVSIHEESAQIVDPLFREKWQNFANRFEPNQALFWGKDLESILVEKKWFPRVYNMPKFGVICKKSHFFRKIVENASLIVPHFACKVNRDLESRTETTSGLILMP